MSSRMSTLCSIIGLLGTLWRMARFGFLHLLTGRWIYCFFFMLLSLAFSWLVGYFSFLRHQFLHIVDQMSHGRGSAACGVNRSPTRGACTRLRNFPEIRLVLFWCKDRRGFSSHSSVYLSRFSFLSTSNVVLMQGRRVLCGRAAASDVLLGSGSGPWLGYVLW